MKIFMSQLITAILLIASTFIVCHLNAQSSDKEILIDFQDQPKNEIKVNLLYFVFETIEISYERIVAEELTIGLAASYWVDESSEYDLILNPYFRFFPGQNRVPCNGFFIEGNAAFIAGERSEIGFNGNSFYSIEDEPYYAGGAGVAVGGKFVSRSNFFGEVYGGLGRIFGDSYVEIYPRVGISFGKRF